jgi:hypothetical protein
VVLNAKDEEESEVAQTNQGPTLARFGSTPHGLDGCGLRCTLKFIVFLIRCSFACVTTQQAGSRFHQRAAWCSIRGISPLGRLDGSDLQFAILNDFTAALQISIIRSELHCKQLKLPAYRFTRVRTCQCQCVQRGEDLPFAHQAFAAVITSHLRPRHSRSVPQSHTANRLHCHRGGSGSPTGTKSRIGKRCRSIPKTHG